MNHMSDMATVTSAIEANAVAFMIIARRTAFQSVDTQAASPITTLRIRSCRKKLLPCPE